MKEKLVVSSCLMGRPTRYDGRSVEYPEAKRLLEKYDVIEVCPEVLGGLETPRNPSERVGERVVMQDGRDVTNEFYRGAARVYEICLENGVKCAVLKERSPSCGSRTVYDGSFSRRLIDGLGVTAEYLRARGIEVFSECEIHKLL